MSVASNEREILAFVPHNTPSKSRVFAIVAAEYGGARLEALATVGSALEADALCRILASEQDVTVFSGLWASLPDSVRASLERARREVVDHDLASSLAPGIPVPHVLPDPSAAHPWAELFRTTRCPDGGCDVCEGCASHRPASSDQPVPNECVPGGRCSCVREDLEDCPCALSDLTPRWAEALYRSLTEHAQVLVEVADDQAVGWHDGALDFLTPALSEQGPEFLVRLADACTALARDLSSGRLPIPQTIAEQMMLDRAAVWAGPEREGAKALQDYLTYSGAVDLPEGWGDYDQDALWFFQIDQDSNFDDALYRETPYKPGELEHIFQPLPVATREHPRPTE